MSVSVATVEDFKRFEKRIESIISNSQKNQKPYLTKDECFEYFGLKERTLTELRGKRAITFTKAGNSYIYKYDSILNYLESNEIEAL